MGYERIRDVFLDIEICESIWKGEKFEFELDIIDFHDFCITDLIRFFPCKMFGVHNRVRWYHPIAYRLYVVRSTQFFKDEKKVIVVLDKVYYQKNEEC